MMQLKTRKEEWWVPVFFCLVGFFLTKIFSSLNSPLGLDLINLTKSPLVDFKDTEHRLLRDFPEDQIQIESIFKLTECSKKKN